jgi:dihydroflavonol-4-reductase
MIFITGGTGLLGSHLLFQLSEEGIPLKAIYRNEGKRNTVRQLFLYYDPLHGLSRYESIEWVLCDVLDVTTLHESMLHCSLVYHCAAIVSFQQKDFFQMMKINRQGTANVVNLCLELGVKKLCYVSSTAAIGGEESSVVSESSKWKQSPKTSGYSISKYSAEKEVWRGIEEGLNAVIINPCVIVGAGNWNESSMTIFKTIDQGLKFYTSGSNAFVDARDVSNCMLTLMGSEIHSERFLVIGENTTFKAFFDEIATRLNKKKAHILVKPWLAGVAWKIAWLVSKITKKPATITKETANSAFKCTAYDKTKLTRTIDSPFRSLHEMVDNAVNGRLS